MILEWVGWLTIFGFSLYMTVFAWFIFLVEGGFTGRVSMFPFLLVVLIASLGWLATYWLAPFTLVCTGCGG